jgi:hypothetical protein
VIYQASNCLLRRSIWFIGRTRTHTDIFVFRRLLPPLADDSLPSMTLIISASLSDTRSGSNAVGAPDVDNVELVGVLDVDDVVDDGPGDDDGVGRNRLAVGGRNPVPGESDDVLCDDDDADDDPVAGVTGEPPTTALGGRIPDRFAGVVPPVAGVVGDGEIRDTVRPLVPPVVVWGDVSDDLAASVFPTFLIIVSIGNESINDDIYVGITDEGCYNKGQYTIIN